ncbi:MAG TPA: DUF4097 family beta strand repeat-containing protein [Gemmatimonadaceae bacterium]|nr:DUF4097 family beta strand repeat-containing protein [Gemmatimonadaceae bacterium]
MHALTARAARSLALPAVALAVALAAVAAAATPLAAQKETDSWSWKGSIAQGRTLYLKNMNGAVRVERAQGSEVEIDARKRATRGTTDHVRIETSRVGRGDGDVLVCALWGERSSCDEDSYNSRSDRNMMGQERNQVNVDFTVRVPEGVRLDLSTVNGELRIEGATDEVRARTVNGSINAASLGGPVSARTVNGSIRVSMGNAGGEDLEYQTVNGSITIEMPDRVDADVAMSTVNGSIDSDFPMTVQGRISRKSVNATLGAGGRKLTAKTVNGSIKLRSRG